MHTYSIPLPRDYAYTQELLDGLQGLVALYEKTRPEERKDHAAALLRCMELVQEQVSGQLPFRYKARFLDQVVTIRAAMKDPIRASMQYLDEYKGCTEKMNGIVTVLLTGLKGEKDGG
ncbi:MAG: hypothetical protein HETSPECPRED_008062 [Heterodermia speciosa]|uniref:Uncharacterized protein n=1 Tax=Heterodermia speciosa TaxID=116794 RepID=A0A8H3ICC6_9LECA|nr:MAG: hypothetical protein HETSPECPRED_008062 [Heterodermia speciosa]